MDPSSADKAQTFWENPVRRLLHEGQPVVGVTITASSVEVAAQAANCGFDFLWIDMEHTPITLETLRQVVLSTRGLKAVPFVRVPVNELWTAKRVLDAGTLGVIFPFASTPELAQQAAAACKYPPTGRRGSGAGLATFRWPAPEGYYDFADRNVMVVAMIEEVKAVENIDAIAATPGIDVLFIGTSDLSFSLGFRGQQDRPELNKAIARVVEAAERHKKVVGRPASHPDQMKDFLQQGFRFFQAPSELNLMLAGARAWLDPLGKSAPDVRARPLY